VRGAVGTAQGEAFDVPVPGRVAGPVDLVRAVTSACQRDRASVRGARVIDGTAWGRPLAREMLE